MKASIFKINLTFHLKRIKSYLTGRLQCICISGECSGAILLLFGVPQGSVLGPVLFTLYNRPIHVISVRCGVADHLYSADIQMYTTFTSPLSLPVLTRRSNG